MVHALHANLNMILPVSDNYKDRCRQVDKKLYYNNIENKTYHCSICNKSFGHKCNLNRHLRTLNHQNEKVNSFEFEQLLANVQEMIKNDTFLQALVNSTRNVSKWKNG